MSKFLDLDTQFSFMAEMLTFLKSVKNHDEIFDQFLLGVTDLTYHIDRCVFVVSEKFNQLYNDEVINAQALRCFRQTVHIEGDVATAVGPDRGALQKRYVEVLNERVNALKAIAHQTGRLETLQCQLLKLKKERQQLIPAAKSLFTLPTYLLHRFENKTRLSRIEQINIALFSIEEFYQSLMDIVRP